MASRKVSSKGTHGRSAINGRFVKLSYAKKHPRTTVVETIKHGKKSKKSK